MQNIAVIGAGTMGNGIAHVFAQKEYRVNLIDISQESLDNGMATIAKNLDRMITKEKISETEKSNTLKNITPITNLADGVQNVDLVVEGSYREYRLEVEHL